MWGLNRLGLAGIVFLLLLPCRLGASEIWIDISGDASFPWPAVDGKIFTVSSPFGMTDVRFTSSSGSSGSTYTSVSSGSYFSAAPLAWTNIYTLLGLDLNPILGAYLAVSVGGDQSVTYSYSLTPGSVWDWGSNTFVSSGSTTWTNVAYTLFPNLPPPQPIQPVYLPPPTITTSNVGITGFNTLGSVENPEPETVFLLVTGLAALVFLRKKLRQA